MKSGLTADVAETYPLRNLFDDENQARIVLSLEKPFAQRRSRGGEAYCGP